MKGKFVTSETRDFLSKGVKDVNCRTDIRNLHEERSEVDLESSTAVTQQMDVHAHRDHLVHSKAAESGRASVFHLSIICFLALLSISLLTSFLILNVQDGNQITEVSSLTAERQQLKSVLAETSKELQSLSQQNAELKQKLSSVTAEREKLKANLTGTTEELIRLQSFSLQNESCPSGWRRFRSSCYLVSTESGSWSEAREDCRTRGADLVVINDSEEQTFLCSLTNKETWIGLNDLDEEETWSWVDGSTPNITFWAQHQPDNGGGDPEWGEEDCVHIRTYGNEYWNDLSCTASLQWICENQQRC